MSRIEVGKRVYVGWTPKERARLCYRDPRCKVGEVTAGPFDPRQDPSMSGRFWCVQIDGHLFDAIESLLFPFDDPDPAIATTTEKAVTA